MGYSNPVVDYGIRLRELCKAAGCIDDRFRLDLTLFPENEVGLRMVINKFREALLRKRIEPPEFPPEVAKFFFGGPLHPEFAT